MKTKVYNVASKTLHNDRKTALELIRELNGFTLSKQPYYILKKLFNKCEQDITIRTPFFCEYGYNISIGKNAFINNNCTFLDLCEITIGDNVLIGPNVQIYTVNHPLNEAERLAHKEICKPIIIENNVWIGGNSVILSGITVGKGVVIGAGSVVTKSIPNYHLAYGNPAKVIKYIGEAK